MEKRTWYVIQHEKDGKCWAVALFLLNYINLASIIRGCNCTIISMNACDSKKEAERIATAWNYQYKQKGVYKWD